MTRYIDADSLEPYYRLMQDNETGIKMMALPDGIVDQQPTVDAVPARHGKWIKGSETKRVKENRYGVLFDAYYCSACESEAYWDSDYGQILFHYCPNCGARMDEDETD